MGPPPPSVVVRGGLRWQHTDLPCPAAEAPGEGAGGSWVERAALPPALRLDAAQFEVLWALHPAEYGEVVIMGRLTPTPRWQQSFGLGYRFSGRQHTAAPIPPLLEPLLAWASSLGLGPFNQVLLNWYQNGHHYIGKHRDDRTQLVPHSPVVSISLGATRTFRIRNWRKGDIVLDVPLQNHTVLIMGGRMQTTHTHEVPRIGGKKGDAIGRRINITFRQFVVADEAADAQDERLPKRRKT
eukprot:EG_transcript_20667